MKFSHLVQINDPKNPNIERLSRAQLWQGLMVRAENPSYFLIGLDECEILERQTDSIRRRLRFGKVTVLDRVTFAPPAEVRYDIEPTAEVPGGSLVMRIEEPEAGQYFVRFEYQLQVDDGMANDYYNEFRKSAYIESDIDTIRMIRQMAASGLLSEAINDPS